MGRTQRIVGYWFPWDKKKMEYKDYIERITDITLDEVGDRPELEIQIGGVGMIQVDPMEFINALAKAIIDYEGEE